MKKLIDALDSMSEKEIEEIPSKVRVDLLMEAYEIYVASGKFEFCYACGGRGENHMGHCGHCDGSGVIMSDDSLPPLWLNWIGK